MHAFPRRAWERETLPCSRSHAPLGFSRSHALRGNACGDALRRVLRFLSHINKKVMYQHQVSEQNEILKHNLQT